VVALVEDFDLRHLPFMQFYPADWIQDTQVLTLEAQGAWIKILCAMWVAPVRGKLIWSRYAFETFLGRSNDATCSLLSELNNVADVFLRDRDSNIVKSFESAVEITLISRRMVREELQRIEGLKADERYRKKRQKNVSETSEKRIRNVQDIS